MLGGSSLKKTAEDLLFNKSLPLTSYKKSTFTLNGKSSVAEVMQTAIGQGNTLVSPMHMALITSAIANGGELMKPYLDRFCCKFRRRDSQDNRTGEI